MNISALLGCLTFYSALYLIYCFFAEQRNPLFLVAAAVLLVLTVFIVPYPYERRRKNFNETLNFETYFTWPLWTYWHVFSFPIRWLLSHLYFDK